MSQPSVNPLVMFEEKEGLPSFSGLDIHSLRRKQISGKFYCLGGLYIYLFKKYGIILKQSTFCVNSCCRVLLCFTVLNFYDFVT